MMTVLNVAFSNLVATISYLNPITPSVSAPHRCPLVLASTQGRAGKKSAGFIQR